METGPAGPAWVVWPWFFLAGLGLAFAAASQTLDVRNSSGLRMSVDTDDRNPALIIVVPDGPEGIRSSKILFPEHVTVRAHGQSDPEHLYIFRHGNEGYSPEWKKTDHALEYARNFGQVHFVARATLKDDGIAFRYEFTNHSGIDYDMVTAITDPRFHTVFYDPRLQRTYVHHPGWIRSSGVGDAGPADNPFGKLVPSPLFGFLHCARPKKAHTTS